MPAVHRLVVRIKRLPCWAVMTASYRPTRLFAGALCIGSLLLPGLAGCSGNSSDPNQAAAGPNAPGLPGGDTAVTPGAPGAPGATNAPGVPGAPGAPGGVDGPAPTPPTMDITANDVGTKPIARLSNYEYDNTVRDLLGTSLAPGRSFVLEETEEGFDNLAGSLAVGSRQYSDYFNAAAQLAADVFSNPDLRGRLLAGIDENACDIACARGFVTNFGLRAFRRPLEQWEVDQLSGAFQTALDLGTTPAEALQHVVHAVLSSPQFLYRMELDAAPMSAEPRALTSYELASRLSYMLWASMPDQQLFDLAASNELLVADTLVAQVDRMLEDKLRSGSLIESFASQWLHIGNLAGHSVDTTVLPDWDTELQVAMQQEADLYFSEFLYGNRPASEFLTADINFVNARLARHYGFDAPAAEGFTQVEVTTDERTGFMGLAGFLTATSKANRTSPIERGNTVLNAILCLKLEVPANLVVGDLPEPSGMRTVRDDLEEHRASPACSGCHDQIDPIGLALEQFGPLGQYREVYADSGLPVDAVGALPGGTEFDGLLPMTQVLSTDPRLMPCMAEQLFTYGLGRTIAGSDPSRPYLQQIVNNWQASDAPTLRNLIKEIVRSDTFRFRRGEAGGMAQ